MPFKVKDLAIALYESSGVVQVGQPSCGGTQLACKSIPFDHLVNDPNNLDVLVEALRTTLNEIEGRIQDREERRATAAQERGGS